MNITRNTPELNSNVNQSLSHIAKGTAVIYIGNIIGMIFGFIGLVLFARFFTAEEYGIFSLGVTLLNITTAISMLGLDQGLPRQIAYYIAQNKKMETLTIIKLSIIFVLITGIALSSLIFILSDVISSYIFQIPKFSLPIKIFCIGIPFTILINIFISIYRGFKKVKEKVIFLDITRSLLFPLFLFPIILIKVPFTWGISAYVLSLIVTSLFFIVYYIKKTPLAIKNVKKNLEFNVGKKLLIFSLPLLLVMIMYQVMAWTDILMLGFYKDAETVGYYNAASPLGKFVSSALGAMLFSYTPIVSEYYAKNKYDELKKSYKILTKWVCSATFPLALILFFFPSMILNILFGKEYIFAALTLQILVAGYFINNLFGPNGATLTAIGKTKFLMYATGLTALINIILNIILIPLYSINGAAIATVISVISVNFLRTIKLHSLNGVYSPDMKILKPIVLSIFISIIYFYIINYISFNTVLIIPISLILLIIIYIIAMLLTNSFEPEDIDLLIRIEKKTGLKLNIFKSIIGRFIK